MQYAESGTDTPHIHFFSGKGGVGKSTIAAASALRASQEQGPVLLVEMAGRQAMARLFDTRELETEPRELRPGLWGMSVDPIQAVEDYLEGELRMPVIARRLARGAFLGRFFEAAPAVFEVASLAKIERLSRRSERGWRGIYVDLDATGHAEMFLSLPKVFQSIAPSGPVRRVLDNVGGVIADGSRSSLHVVTGAEPVMLEETRAFIKNIRSKGDVPLRGVIINECEPELPLESAGASLDAYQAWLSDVDAPGLSAELEFASAQRRRASAQARAAESLRDELRVEVRRVPWTPRMDSGEGLSDIVDALEIGPEDAHG